MSEEILINITPMESRVAVVENGVIAGRLAYLAGRMPRKLYASASSPLDGLIK